jgi:hypothetical protein
VDESVTTGGTPGGLAAGATLTLDMLTMFVDPERARTVRQVLRMELAPGAAPD